MQNLADLLRIEGGGDLIRQHYFRPQSKASGNRHPLLLTAGNLARLVLQMLFQADTDQKFGGGLASLGARQLQYLFQWF